MDLQKFTIIKKDEQHEVVTQTEEMLLNMQHVVSIKPINMIIDSEVVNGFWIRTSNGKKYRAIKIPKEIEKKFSSN